MRRGVRKKKVETKQVIDFKNKYGQLLLLGVLPIFILGFSGNWARCSRWQLVL